MESKYTLGILLASCVLLIGAIALTWLDINKYNADGTSVSSGPSRVRTPARDVDGDEEADDDDDDESADDDDDADADDDDDDVEDGDDDVDEGDADEPTEDDEDDGEDVDEDAEP